MKDLLLNQLPCQRALGIRWDFETDTFGFKISLKDKPYTRRGILSIVSFNYDSLGFVAPFILQAKRLLQNLRQKGLGWDNEDITTSQSWVRGLPKLESLKFIDVSRQLTSVTSQLVRSTTLLMPVRSLTALCPTFASQTRDVSFIVHSSWGNTGFHHSSFLPFVN